MSPERLTWRNSIMPVAITLALCLAVFVNIAVTPEDYVTSGFFTIAIVLAVPCYRPITIAIVDAVAVAVYLFTVWIQHNTPTSVWLVGVLTLVVVGVLGTWVSSQRELAEQSARDAETERYRMERLLSLVSHELRGALTPVIGQVQLMQRRGSKTLSDREQRTLASIGEGAERLNRMIADLGDTHHLRRGRLRVERSSMDLAQTARRAVADVQRESDHTIVVDAPEQLQGVWDSVRLYQVVRNLVSNATKYSPRGSEVRVRLYGRSTVVVIEVSDQGEGITASDQQQLFEPFMRFSDSNSAQGMGLGLYITKGIVEAHGGRIDIRGSSGRGTTFIVTLPREMHVDTQDIRPRGSDEIAPKEDVVPIPETTS